MLLKRGPESQSLVARSTRHTRGANFPLKYMYFFKGTPRQGGSKIGFWL